MIRVAVNGDKEQARAFVEGLQQRAKGKDEKLVVLASDADLQRFLEGKM